MFILYRTLYFKKNDYIKRVFIELNFIILNPSSKLIYIRLIMPFFLEYNNNNVTNILNLSSIVKIQKLKYQL